MADQKEEALNQAAEPVTSSPEVEKAQGAEPKVSAPEETKGEVKNLPEGEEEKKPSRLEKRVKQLEEKRGKIDDTLKRLKSVAQFHQEGKPVDRLPWEVGASEPLIKPEEYVEGIDPKVLEERLSRQRLADKEAIKKEVIAEFEYKSKIQDHLNDVEDCKKIPELDEKSEKYDPELASLVVEQYNLANSVYDPFSGGRVFIPKVKMSEIYNRYKPVIEKWRTKGEVQATQKVVEQIGETAVAPSSQKKTSEPSLEEMRSQLWSNPGKVAEYLEKKLPKS